MQSDKGWYAKDDSEKLDILLLINNLTLGDRPPMDLMRHLLAASGLDRQTDRQTDKFISYNSVLIYDAHKTITVKTIIMKKMSAFN